jgi:hypothetical protein
VVGRAFALLDHETRGAAPAEIGGERKPNRAAADDQHRRFDCWGTVVRHSEATRAARYLGAPGVSIADFWRAGNATRCAG